MATIGAASGSAPGKVILFGEHAVVYGKPAIAVPLTAVRAHAVVMPLETGSGVILEAADIPGGLRRHLDDLAADDPLRSMILMAFRAFTEKPTDTRDVLVRVSSSIPIGRGLGSGAAVGTAIVRSVAEYCGQTPGVDEIAELVFEIEKLFHGTPSGIDNTVIAYEMPIYFVRDQAPNLLDLGSPLNLVIGDAGPASPTREVVSFVRQRWQDSPSQYEDLFARIGEISQRARGALEVGDMPMLGRLMRRNHEVLRRMGVSSPELDHLVEAAEAAGALGAKLCGAGWGGNMVALVEAQSVERVAAQLRGAGAERVIISDLRARS